MDSPDFDCDYLAAMLRASSAGTGMFSLRLVWNSVAGASKRLNRASTRVLPRHKEVSPFGAADVIPWQIMSTLILFEAQRRRMLKLQEVKFHGTSS